jgi:transcriptional regulator GlxA family with amidase domain
VNSLFLKITFIREFKRNIGLAPHHFQIQNRIRQAKHLLTQDDNVNITEVALATGFCDQSHFTKCFKRIVGLTPSQYIEAQNSVETEQPN